MQYIPLLLRYMRKHGDIENVQEQWAAPHLREQFRASHQLVPHFNTHTVRVALNLGLLKTVKKDNLGKLYRVTLTNKGHKEADNAPAI